MALSINANKSNTYSVNRRDYYEKLGEQLDNLFHDIEAGKFGETPKTGAFYLGRKAVKDKFPKSSP
tara:strand:- start:3748 stop:3945 length:198 start_codon:yes stop_codon:yes gene_type:complete